MKKQAGRLLSLAMVLCLAVTSVSILPTETKAADINNIGNPVYHVQKNMAGTDAFVYAYNVLDYGADNTGNNDNTTIFQRLIDKMANLGGGIIYVPSGRYKVTGSLRIKKGVTLRGDWKEPTAGQPLTSGTILMAYVGRGQGESSTPFMETEVEVGVMDMTIWYPEQNPNNIVQYSPTIRLGCNGYFGNEYANIKNVTLVNSYIGIWWNTSNGGASPVLNGIYGTPLKKGIEIDCIADVGRIDHVSFSPNYWSGSGLDGAPAKGSSFENWIYENGTGIVMRRNDWSYACYINIDGYHVGYNTKVSTEGNGSTPNGHHYKFHLKNCKVGILFETSNYVGILFDDITAYNCETGVQMNGGTTDTIQFAKSKFTCSRYAFNIDRASTTKVLLYNSTIEKGVVNMDGGTLMSTGCTYNNKAPQIALGSLGRASLAGNTFANGKNILNNSIYKSELDNANIPVTPVPDFPDEKSQYQSHLPAKLDLYVVTNAPYNANNSTNHGGGNDCTGAIQNALNDAAANGGGIVFLPSGHYRVNGHLTIPSNVELRGATDLSTVPHGSGAIIEAYENKGNPNGAPLLGIATGAGVRGIIVNYPEQTYQLDGNGEYHPADYPATMQGQGAGIYVINTGIRAATYGLDLDTYRCDNHYVEWLTGHVNKICVKVGKGATGGIINNLMFNTIVYGCGRENPKFGGFPNSPNTPGGESNAAVYDQQLRELEFLIVGDTNNETLYNCFPYGAYIGTKLINEGNGGPQNLMSMGLGIDGSRKSIYFGSGLTGRMDFIDNQIVSLNNDQPITRYLETEGNSSFTANLFNTDLWGFPEKAVVMNDNSGTLNLYTANFQQRGYNGALTVGNGSKLNVTDSSLNTNNARFSTGSNNISVVNTVADYTQDEANAFASNVANFATSVEIDGNSQATAQINRNGWTATSNVNNNMAMQSLDGNLNTQWNASWQAPGQWYQVDMGSAQSFDTIVTTLGNTADSPGAYKVLVSNNGNDWREVASGQNNNIYSVGNQTARYVRIEQSSNAGKFWAIYEFYVLKSASYDVGEGEPIDKEEETTPQPATQESTTEQGTTPQPTTEKVEPSGEQIQTTPQIQPTESGRCDLVITNIRTKENYGIGDEALFVATIKNIGTASTPAEIKHGLALSVDGQVVNWCDTFFGPMTPGQEQDLVMNWGPNAKDSWTVTAGMHTVSALIDDQSLIEEANENNNTYETAMTFTDHVEETTLSVTTKEENAQSQAQTTVEEQGNRLPEPLGFVWSGNENLPYYFSWQAVEGAAHYNFYVNGALIANTVDTAYNAAGDVFAIAGDYHVQVAAVGADGVEGVRAHTSYISQGQTNPTTGKIQPTTGQGQSTTSGEHTTTESTNQSTAAESNPTTQVPETTEPINKNASAIEAKILSNQNIAVGKTATSSSTTTANGYQPYEAVDQNVGTMWGAATTGKDEWLAIDLGEKTKIGSVAIVWEGAYASQYEIQVSDDGINYNIIRTIAATQAETIEAMMPQGTQGRYVRIYATEPGTVWELKIREVGIFKPEGVEESTTEKVDDATTEQNQSSTVNNNPTTEGLDNPTTTKGTDTPTTVNDRPTTNAGNYPTTGSYNPTTEMNETTTDVSQGATSGSESTDIVTRAETTSTVEKVTTTRENKVTQAVKVGKTKVKRATKKVTAKKLKVKLKKIKGATGYQIRVYKGKKNKKAIFKKNLKKNKVKVTLKSKKLVNKKKLFVRARAYILVNGTKIYGKWSKVKKVKVQ